MLSPPLWVLDLADRFWQQTEGPEAFPRRLREPLLFSAWTLTVLEIPRLCTQHARHFLDRMGRPNACLGTERALRGCLLASGKGGLILLDADDDLAERTFTLAHEIAHFLRDHDQPRSRALAALGPGIREVLDGARPARPAERLQALLRRVPLTAHCHLMDRHADHVRANLREAENGADRLALELLAPHREIERALPNEATSADLTQLLTARFGLPPTVAIDHARRVLPASSPRFWGKIGKIRQTCVEPGL